MPFFLINLLDVTTQQHSLQVQKLREPVKVFADPPRLGHPHRASWVEIRILRVTSLATRAQGHRDCTAWHKLFRVAQGKSRIFRRSRPSRSAYCGCMEHRLALAFDTYFRPSWRYPLEPLHRNCLDLNHSPSSASLLSQPIVVPARSKSMSSLVQEVLGHKRMLSWLFMSQCIPFLRTSMTLVSISRTKPLQRGYTGDRVTYKSWARKNCNRMGWRFCLVHRPVVRCILFQSYGYTAQAVFIFLVPKITDA